MPEYIATVIVVAVVSTLVGVIGIAMVFVLVVYRKTNRNRQLNAIRRRWSRWLAARRTMSRATVSLVAAFRALRRDQPGEVSRSWRYDEAQRARAYWHDALREHERAEADLEVGHWLANVDTHFISPRHPASDGFRAAITGSPDDTNALLLRVQAVDHEASAFAMANIQRELTKQRSNFQNPLSRFVVRWARFMSQLVDSWASG